jgi:chromosome partitioning protein
MPVITTTNPKGGSGKSTTALVLALTFAARGARVSILDADVNQPIKAWHAGRERSVTVLGGLTDDTIVDAILCERSHADLVIVDNEGVANVMSTRAAALADLVLIPMQASALDAAQAGRAVRMVEAEAKLRARPIAIRTLLTRTSPAVLPRRQKEIEAELRRIGVPMLTTRLHSRAAFEAIFHFRTTLAELDRAKVDGVDKAIANAETLADEITVTLRKIGEERAVA